MKREIRTIPISAISVVNSRSRNKKKFKELVTSVEHLGLKRPITVNIRNGEKNYELVCGEGRIEAFRALGKGEIPAILIDVDADDSFLMGLVENLARRQPSAIEVFSEVSRLAKRGYKINEIAAKPVNPVTFDALRKMKPERQIEACSLMASTSNFFVQLRQGAGRRQQARRYQDASPIPARLGRDGRGSQIDGTRIDARPARFQANRGLLRSIHGRACRRHRLRRKARSARIARYLDDNHPEVLNEFRKIVSATSLDTPGALGPPNLKDAH